MCPRGIMVSSHIYGLSPRRTQGRSCSLMKRRRSEAKALRFCQRDNYKFTALAFPRTVCAIWSMPKRSRKLKSATEQPKQLSDYLPRRDANEAAFDVIQQIIAGTD